MYISPELFTGKATGCDRPKSFFGIIYARHLQHMVKIETIPEVVEGEPSKQSLVVEIASNDGSLLQCFKSEGSGRCINPATNMSSSLRARIKY